MNNRVNFDAQGLAPAVVQDARTGRVLMLGYVTAESLQRTLAEGEVWFYSRSRRELWHKGATSSNRLLLRRVVADCDSDAVLLLVEPTGPTCHTGARSCFFNAIGGEGVVAEGEPADLGPASLVLADLEEVIAQRDRERPEGSYTARLLAGGVDRTAKKVVEEAGEVVIAAKNADPEEIAREMADLWFHSLVLLRSVGVPASAVWDELRRRRG